MGVWTVVGGAARGWLLLGAGQVSLRRQLPAACGWSEEYDNILGGG